MGTFGLHYVSAFPLALLYTTWNRTHALQDMWVTTWINKAKSCAKLCYSLNRFFGIFCLFSHLCKVLVSIWNAVCIWEQNIEQDRRESWKVTNFLSSFITVRDDKINDEMGRYVTFTWTQWTQNFPMQGTFMWELYIHMRKLKWIWKEYTVKIKNGLTSIVFAHASARICNFAISSSENIASNDRMIIESQIGKDVKESCSLLNFRYYHNICPEGLRETMKHLSQQCYNYNSNCIPHQIQVRSINSFLSHFAQFN